MTGRRRPRGPLSVAPRPPPHEPDIAPEHKAVILAALRRAWAELRRSDRALLKTGDEEQITVQIQRLLNEQRGRRRTGQLEDFETVTRGESQTTADGRISKKPDLTFRPIPYRSVTNRTGWGWFVECKLVDGEPSLAEYRDSGVQRFSSGEYAAWMPSAAMLGYVRDCSSPVPALDPVLRGFAGTKHVRAGSTTDIAESEHDRSRLVNPCVDVVITHIWLSTA